MNGETRHRDSRHLWISLFPKPVSSEDMTVDALQIRKGETLCIRERSLPGLKKEALVRSAEGLEKRSLSRPSSVPSLTRVIASPVNCRVFRTDVFSASLPQDDRHEGRIQGRAG